MNNADIVRRADQLKSNRSTIDQYRDEVNRYILPLSGTSFFAQRATEGTKKWDTRDIWDSTAPIGAQRLASYLWASLINPTFQWFGIGFSAAKVNQNPEARRWTDDTTDRMFDTLTASNFALEMAIGLLALVGHGNTAMTQELANEKKWEGFEFGTPPLEEVVFEEDYRGRVYRFYRFLSMSAVQMISKFGEEGVPERIKELAKQDAGSQKEGVIFCIYPRTDKPQMAFGEKVRAPAERPFGFKYVLVNGLDMLGEEGGFYEMPAYVGRWMRAAGSVWGFGPGILALPTVKLLNALQEEIVLAAGKVVDPAVLVTERGLLSDLDLERGGQTTVRSLEDIAPFESKARFDVSEALLADHRAMVRKFFREDDIQLKDSPAMTATEAQLRTEMMNRLFGGPVAQIQNDIFDPVIQNTFNAMLRHGQIEKPPDIVLEAASQGAGIKIEYRGPFSRAMRSDEVAALERLGASVAAMMKMNFPEAGDVFNAGQVIREMADKLSVPATVLRTPQEAAKAKAEREQMQMAAAQAEIAKTAAEAKRANAGAEEMMGGMNGNGQ